MGAHHAGQLPSWKILLEQLMTAGLLEAVFATTTVAAGVNFPARTIALLNSLQFPVKILGLGSEAVLLSLQFNSPLSGVRFRCCPGLVNFDSGLFQDLFCLIVGLSYRPGSLPLRDAQLPVEIHAAHKEDNRSSDYQTDEKNGC